MKHFYDTFVTPFGPFSVATDATGAVTATAFGKIAALRRRVRGGRLTRNTAVVAPARAQLLSYFSGKRRVFSVPLAAAGTAFQRTVWAALQTIPLGHIRTYGEIASAIGRPHAARAVGRANATNPICVLIPCHRVVGADGSLTGFAFGAERKRRLLLREGVSLKPVNPNREAARPSSGAVRRPTQ